MHALIWIYLQQIWVLRAMNKVGNFIGSKQSPNIDENPLSHHTFETQGTAISGT